MAKKIMKVELRTHRTASETQGSLYQSEEWKVPYDSLKDPMGETALEEHLKRRISEQFPDPFIARIKDLMYGDMSQGGSVIYNDTTLTVSFQKDQSAPLV